MRTLTLKFLLVVMSFWLFSGELYAQGPTSSRPLNCPPGSPVCSWGGGYQPGSGGAGYTSPYYNPWTPGAGSQYPSGTYWYRGIQTPAHVFDGGQRGTAWMGGVNSFQSGAVPQYWTRVDPPAGMAYFPGAEYTRSNGVSGYGATVVLQFDPSLYDRSTAWRGAPSADLLANGGWSSAPWSPGAWGW